MVRTSNALALLKVLITASWADSRLSQSELNYIKELARHFDLSDDDWFELQPYIEDPVSKEEREAILRDLLARISTSSERNAIIGHIERIISADDTISEDEKELLRKYEDILREPSSLDLMMGGVKALFGKPETRSTLDVDEFLRNKILFKLRRTIGSDQITPDMHRTALLGGLMGIVAHADHDIHEQELEEIRVQLSREGNFDDDTMDLLLNIVEEESVRGLDRYRLITEYTKDVTPEGRVELLDLLFGVAAADGEVGHHELEELRSMSSSLGLSHKQYIAAKIRQKPGS
jgi:uncharacterized tellurite resistance protein B-like protein